MYLIYGDLTHANFFNCTIYAHVLHYCCKPWAYHRIHVAYLNLNHNLLSPISIIISKTILAQHDSTKLSKLSCLRSALNQHNHGLTTRKVQNNPFYIKNSFHFTIWIKKKYSGWHYMFSQIAHCLDSNLFSSMFKSPMLSAVIGNFWSVITPPCNLQLFLQYNSTKIYFQIDKNIINSFKIF